MNIFTPRTNEYEFVEENLKNLQDEMEPVINSLHAISSPFNFFFCYQNKKNQFIIMIIMIYNITSG